jgi:hypothetical protein
MTERQYARRWLFRVGGLILFFVVGHFVHREWQFWSNGKYLNEVLAETDRLDPGWRWEEIEAKRQSIPDEENAALIVQKVKSHLGKQWEYFDQLLEKTEYRDLPNEELLESSVKSLLDLMLDEHREAVLAARKLRHCPRGYYPLEMKPNPLVILMEPVQHTRHVARILSYDTLRLANENKADEAIQSIFALLNLARSLEDCPQVIPMLVRVALDHIATDTTERLLALTVPKSNLKELAQRLLEEAEQPIFLQAMRSERALYHRMFENLESGQLDLKEFFESFELIGIRPESVSQFQVYLYRPKVLINHGITLEGLNQMIESGKKASHLTAQELKSLQFERTRGLEIATLALQFTDKSFDAAQRNQAKLRCASVALFVEIHRQRHGQWPESLDKVDKDLLPEVPLDPYDGKPLRMIAEETGVVIYSIGSDLVDNQGSIDRSPPLNLPLDWGFRLLDPTERRVEAIVLPEVLPPPQELELPDERKKDESKPDE